MISSLLLAAACGTVCGNRVVAQAYVQPYAVAAPVYYFVGAPIRAQSLLELQKQQDPDYQQFLEFKQWKEAQQHPAQAEAVTGPTRGPVSLVCGKCHSGNTPKGEFYLDGSPGMRAEDITRAIRMIAEDKMPPKTKLSRDEKNALLSDLLRLEATGEELPPAEPTPIPDPVPVAPIQPLIPPPDPSPGIVEP